MMDGKKIDQDPMQMPSWSLGMAMAWIACREIGSASELWQTSLEAALFEEDDETGLNRSFLEAETTLKNTLHDGGISATGLRADGSRIVVPLLEWEDMEFTYGMDKDGSLFHRATSSTGSMYTDLRVKRADILACWPATEQTANTNGHRRGPRPKKLEATKLKMIDYNNAHGDLKDMTEAEMETRFGASRDVCRKARNQVAPKLRLIATSDK